MPPYNPVVSKAQSRALFAKARRGEMSLEDARGKTRAANFDTLPERVGGKKPSRSKKSSPKRSMSRGK